MYACIITVLLIHWERAVERANKQPTDKTTVSLLMRKLFFSFSNSLLFCDAWVAIVSHQITHIFFNRILLVFFVFVSTFTQISTICFVFGSSLLARQMRAFNAFFSWLIYSFRRMICVKSAAGPQSMGDLCSEVGDYEQFSRLT